MPLQEPQPTVPSEEFTATGLKKTFNSRNVHVPPSTVELIAGFDFWRGRLPVSEFNIAGHSRAIL